ncbi:MAG: polysaccharide deacetylase family protein [Pseudomonadota bacterium]|nr:polysaccharide deacetylase family protein [Pseudomonadota bacterium]
MDGLDPLRAELDAWGEAGETATLWWRDDDAEAPTDQVRRMLDLSARHAAPVFVAVVPGKAVDALAAPVLDCPTAVPVQHGWMHADHSPADVKGKWELGLHRPVDAILEELARGRTRMIDLFDGRFQPMLGPPWNRIAPDLLPHLPAAGYDVLSVFGPRAAACPVEGLRAVNGHCDIIGWKRDRAFIGADKTAGRLAEHLRARRGGMVDAAEPTGLLTHVWLHDDAIWQVMDDLLALVAAHPAARWLGAAEVMHA